MKIAPITSSSNALLKKIRGLQQRREREKTGLFLVEGKKAIAEAFAKKLAIQDVVVSKTFLEQEPDVVASNDVAGVSVVDDKLFKELSTTTTPEGVIAVARMPRYEFGDLFKSNVKNPLIVIAHSIQDPGNLGTIVRTALAASACGMILTKGTVDAFSPKVVRSASGALFAMPMVWDVAFADIVAMLKERNVRIVACHMHADKHYFEADLRSAVAITLGNEGQGFSDADLALVDEVVSIPMNPQSESLNVAASAAIVLFSAVQQRLSGTAG